MTNVDKLEGLAGPMGQFMNVKRYPPADYRGVSAPNADTLYSAAWIDLAKEPWVFTHPDIGKRYYLLPMYSLWMPVIYSGGSRTTGEKAGSFLLTGPGWNGEVPQGMTQVKSPTRYMLILGRTYANGTEEDYEAVNALQAQYDLRPLSALGKAGWKFTAPPVNPDPGFSNGDARILFQATGKVTIFYKLSQSLNRPNLGACHGRCRRTPLRKARVAPGLCNPRLLATKRHSLRVG
jgi:hypothetical protein